jgi:hypothetical protein
MVSPSYFIQKVGSDPSLSFKSGLILAGYRHLLFFSHSGGAFEEQKPGFPGFRFAPARGLSCLHRLILE